METINNKSSNNIKTYITYTNEEKENINNSNEINSNELYYIGKKSNSDLFINGIGDNVYFVLFKINDNKPNSWIIYNKDNNKIIKKEFNDFLIDITKQNIEIHNKSKSHKYIIIIIIIIFIIFIILIFILIFYQYRLKDKNINNNKINSQTIFSQQIVKKNSNFINLKDI